MISSTSCAQKQNRKSPQETVTAESGDLTVRVVYSRPFKNDRLIFGDEDTDALVPFGEKWRTGANEATEITINKDVDINGEQLVAGTYSVYTIPEKDRWIIAFNSRTDYWGKSLFGSPFKEKNDVLRIEVPAKTTSESIEQFTIHLKATDSNDIDVSMVWDTTEVSFTLK